MGCERLKWGVIGLLGLKRGLIGDFRVGTIGQAVTMRTHADVFNRLRNECRHAVVVLSLSSQVWWQKIWKLRAVTTHEHSLLQMLLWCKL